MEKSSIAQKQEFKKSSGFNKEKEKGKKTEYDMLVFSHLRWGFVYQRPQHIISRLSANYHILFIEEPVHFDVGEEKSFELEIINQNLHVLKPKVSDIPSISNILKPLIKNGPTAVGWFYSAAFSPLLTDFRFDKVIYDCMDELSLFKGAPSELINQEKFLLSEANIVFTGGKSLYESKHKSHNNVHCFPSSVEQEHFRKASQEKSLSPEDLQKINSPMVGYCGVIDERIDLDLLQKTAILLPEIAFIMVGPLAKIQEEDLPREENIHYLGMKPYNSLPVYLATFDIAMMPFALNDSTKFISPTKTLEYMAAGKPIISTAIKDIMRDYSNCIPIIASAEEFANAIKNILKDPKDFSADYKEILSKTSWDSTAAQMEEIIKSKVK
ncbi:glycosyltransferase [Zunongwangia sp. F363]|uniref:Glycosyltransferase n=1 Tax=Autumnicola tepida TaxID=3075595 RepID=A0ABU3CEJ4_9FLAO|nr:glycosyltransferase [Zunongwangia sp. F363]MDT0644726.1 glycosyltransferase [Zunongwangia sp. F363]